MYLNYLIIFNSRFKIGHNVLGSPHLLPQGATHAKNCANLISGSGNGTATGLGVGNRLPPAYNVAAQRALLHRLGRAHSHEGVTSSISISPAPLGYYQPSTDDTGTYSNYKKLIFTLPKVKGI